MSQLRFYLPYLFMNNLTIFGLRMHRHYTFYIWSRFLSKDHLRIAISPLYYACFLWTIGSLQRARGTIWVLIYLTALFLTTVPAHLLEPRYFTPGVVVAILNMPPWETKNCSRESEGTDSSSSTSKSSGNSIWKRVKEGLLYARGHAIVLSIVLCLLVDTVTIYVFLYRPFTWHDGTVARFMF
jgi:alpha-1,2-glucosyltransferase